MLKKFFAVGSLAATALSLVSLSVQAALPSDLDGALKKAKIPAENVSVWIAPAGSTNPIVSLNENAPRTPASVMKTVTTLAGLELLSPAYTWKTTIYAAADADAKTGTVQGVGIKGEGDPNLVIERLWLIVEQLAGRGVRNIVGDITIDRSLFAVGTIDQDAFDGRGSRTYNVGPDAAMLNLKTASFRIVPVSGEGVARISMLPYLDGLDVTPSVPLSKKACSQGRNDLVVTYGPGWVKFSGSYPESCGPEVWHASLWNADEFWERSLKHLFAQTGISWTGKVVPGTVKGDGVELVEDYSVPLTQIVSYINKFSSNPMARQLFLTLSFTDAQGKSAPASLERSRAVVSKWLSDQGIDPKSIYIENGSGLSRDASVTAKSLGLMLTNGWKSDVMPEFMASLPISGVDGTMRKRRVPGGSAHVKTGYIVNVRSIAGYVTDKNGNRWVVVGLVNGKTNMGNGRFFLDQVLAWTAQKAATYTTK